MNLAWGKKVSPIFSVLLISCTAALAQIGKPCDAGPSDPDTKGVIYLGGDSINGIPFKCVRIAGSKDVHAGHWAVDVEAAKVIREAENTRLNLAHAMMTRRLTDEEFSKALGYGPDVLFSPMANSGYGYFRKDAREQFIIALKIQVLLREVK